MNILYVGNAQGFDNARKYYMIPQKLVNGLTRLGHNVYIFNDRDYVRASNMFGSSRIGQPKLNRKLVEICRDFAPDLIVLGHCEMIENETLMEIRAMLPDCRMVYRNVDPLHSTRTVEKIHRRKEVVDGIFLTTAGDSLKQFSNPRGFVCYMPNPIDASIETGRAFAQGNPVDVFFAGGFIREFRDTRSTLLDRLRANLPEVKTEFHVSTSDADALFGHRYMQALPRAKIGLALNKSENYLYASDRMAQYLGNGLFVLIDRRSGFQDLFGPDEMGFFADEGELTDLIRHWAANDEARRTGAAKAWEKGHRLFDSTTIARFMLEKTFGQPLSQDYVWPIQSH